MTLLAWEKSSNGQTQRLVVISSGDVQSTRAEGFRSTVLLDEAPSVGAAFGANGTPMAILVVQTGVLPLTLSRAPRPCSRLRTVTSPA